MKFKLTWVGWKPWLKGFLTWKALGAVGVGAALGLLLNGCSGTSSATTEAEATTTEQTEVETTATPEPTEPVVLDGCQNDHLYPEPSQSCQ